MLETWDPRRDTQTNPRCGASATSKEQLVGAQEGKGCTHAARLPRMENGVSWGTHQAEVASTPGLIRLIPGTAWIRPDSATVARSFSGCTSSVAPLPAPRFSRRSSVGLC